MEWASFAWGVGAAVVVGFLFVVYSLLWYAWSIWWEGNH